MAESLLPHNLSHDLAELMAKVEVALDPVLLQVGAEVERVAKIHAGEGGSHRAGTKTPASRGGGPAVITGDLRRAVTHELAGTHTVRIGAADVPHRAAKSTWRPPKATAGQIGGYVEAKGYPWLTPAADESMLAVDALISEALGAELAW